jgi:hypothetical protein
LLASASERQAFLWCATLTPVQNALLRTPAIAQALAQWVSGHGWVEYVVLGAPFGVLGRDAQGATGWLQLEPHSGLNELAELADAVGATPAMLARIRQGAQLMAVDLYQALGRSDPPPLAPAFALGDDDTLLGALFSVPVHGPGYAQWLAAQTPRHTGF